MDMEKNKIQRMNSWTEEHTKTKYLGLGANLFTEMKSHMECKRKQGIILSQEKIFQGPNSESEKAPYQDSVLIHMNCGSQLIFLLSIRLAVYENYAPESSSENMPPFKHSLQIACIF